MGIFNSMRSVLLIPHHNCILPCLMIDCQVSRCKEAKIDYVLCVCKWVDVFPPCFDWWKLYSRKGYSQFVIYTLDDQHSLENAFPSQLSLQPDPVQMNFQDLKEKGKGDKCPAQMFSSVCFQPGTTPFFTGTQDINELAGFCSVFHLGLSSESIHVCCLCRDLELYTSLCQLCWNEKLHKMEKGSPLFVLLYRSKLNWGLWLFFFLKLKRYFLSLFIISITGLFSFYLNTKCSVNDCSKNTNLKLN